MQTACSAYSSLVMSMKREVPRQSSYKATKKVDNTVSGQKQSEDLTQV